MRCILSLTLADTFERCMDWCVLANGFPSVCAVISPDASSCGAMICYFDLVIACCEFLQTMIFTCSFTSIYLSTCEYCRATLVIWARNVVTCRAFWRSVSPRKSLFPTHLGHWSPRSDLVVCKYISFASPWVTGTQASNTGACMHQFLSRSVDFGDAWSLGRGAFSPCV